MDDERVSHTLKKERHCFGVPRKPMKTVDTPGKAIRPLQGKGILCVVATNRPK